MQILKNSNKYIFVIACVSFVTLIAFGSTKVILFFSDDKTSLTSTFLKEDSLLFIFILVVVLGPLVETLIFQFCIIELFSLINRSRFIKVIALIVSSLLFGLSHSSSLEYIIKGIISGFLFSSCYLQAKERKDISPFFLVFMVHASSNLFVFMINEIL